MACFALEEALAFAGGEAIGGGGETIAARSAAAAASSSDGRRAPLSLTHRPLMRLGFRCSLQGKKARLMRYRKWR